MSEVEIPDPFQIPAQPSLNQEQLQSLAALVHSDAWKAVIKVFEWQRKRLTSVLYNTTDNHAAYQGMIKGVVLAQDAVENAHKYIRTPEEPAPLKPDEEAQFYNDWEKRSSISGY